MQIKALDLISVKIIDNFEGKYKIIHKYQYDITNIIVLVIGWIID
jgi:hypothetical protein